MEMELKIAELAKEYKENRDAFMRVRPKTKKNVRGFENFLFHSHLKKNDIMETEKKYFDFCDFCKEIMFFRCYDFNLAWEFTIPCRCERTLEAEEKSMRERIKKHKKFQKELENDEKMPRLF